VPLQHSRHRVRYSADCRETVYRPARFLVSTDDACVQAHSVLSAKMPGYISEVPINDNQSVKAGEVIARIDPYSRCCFRDIDKYV
jgi:hypothetical protein